VIYKLAVTFQKDFLEISGNQITMGIEKKPVKGEANKEIIKKLAKHFQIPASHVKIRSGHKSKQKVLEIQF